MSLGITKVGILGANSRNDRSIDMSASGQYFSMTDGNFGSYSSQKFAIRATIKRSTVSSNCHIAAQGTGTTALDAFYALFNASNNIELALSDGTTSRVLDTTSTFSSTSSFYRIYIEVDTTQAVQADRVKIYVNESLQSLSGTYPTLSMNINNSSQSVMWGADSGGGSTLRALLYRPAFFSATLPGISGAYLNSREVDVRAAGGIKSHLYTTSSSTLEDDYILSANWTNNGSIVKSEVVP